MAAEFVGCAVDVTLSNPSGAHVKGVIIGVAGRKLSLRDATLWDGRYLPSFQIEAEFIVDLALQPQKPAAAPAAAPVPAPAAAAPTPVPFQDPAIVSMTKPPPSTSTTATAPAAVAPPKPTAPTTLPTHQNPPPPPPPSFLRRDGTKTQLNKAFEQLHIRDEPKKKDPYAAAPRRRDRLSRKSAGASPAAEAGVLPSPVHERVSRLNPAKPAKSPTTTPQYTGKGWRHTPLVEPANDSAASPAPGREKRRTRERKPKRSRYAEASASGWATEDATDIQEMGDFDFASNLSKFDKRRVFDEIRSDDNTRKEDRLVTFNRRARPGTNGGRNLHPLENVLDMSDREEEVPVRSATANNGWNSEADETEDEDSEGVGASSGRGSRRPRSRTSKKSSTAIPPSILPRGSLGSMTTTSPRAGHSTGGTPSRVGSLWLSTTKRPCTAISPLQQLELEQLTADEIGLSEEILAENAGRGIAEAAILYTTDLTASSPILILAGNHKTGIRAACACRHLRSRGYRVTLCVLGMEREDEFIEGLTKQIKIVKKLGAKVVRWQEFAASLTATDYMPDLIIDALFGIHVSYDELRVDDQATVYEAINWVNHSDIEVMSIDIPSGLSATNGERSTIQGSVLCVEPSIVLCLAAPKTGLLHALGAKYTVHWQLFVIDIGIGAPVWKKFGNRRRHGVHFGSSWIVPLMYQDASS